MHGIAPSWNKVQDVGGDEPHRDVFYHHFRYPNQFRDSVFAGHKHHAVDLLFMFQMYNHPPPTEYAETTRDMGCSYVLLTGLGRGGGVAEEHNYPAMCYGPSGIALVERGRDTIIRYAAFDEFGGLQDEWTKASRSLIKEIIRG